MNGQFRDNFSSRVDRSGPAKISCAAYVLVEFSLGNEAHRKSFLFKIRVHTRSLALTSCVEEKRLECIIPENKSVMVQCRNPEPLPGQNYWPLTQPRKYR